MKRMMYTLGIVGAVGLGILAATAFKPAEVVPANDDIVLVRATIGSSAWSKILISYGDTNTEVIKLASFDPQNFVSNNETIAATLNRIKGEGYELVGTSGGGAGTGFVIQNYVFNKK